MTKKQMQQLAAYVVIIKNSKNESLRDVFGVMKEAGLENMSPNFYTNENEAINEAESLCMSDEFVEGCWVFSMNLVPLYEVERVEDVKINKLTTS